MCVCTKFLSATPTALEGFWSKYLIIRNTYYQGLGRWRMVNAYWFVSLHCFVLLITLCKGCRHYFLINLDTCNDTVALRMPHKQIIGLHLQIKIHITVKKVFLLPVYMVHKGINLQCDHLSKYYIVKYVFALNSRKGKSWVCNSYTASRIFFKLLQNNKHILEMMAKAGTLRCKKLC